MTIPTSGFYNTILQSFFGDLDAADQQKLWSAFLLNTGQTSNPSETDPLLKAQFVKFASGVLDRQSDAIGFIQLPPEEVAKRRLLFDAFEAVMKMLNVVQNTIAEQAQLLIFYGNYQQEYTKALSQVPLYTTNNPTSWTTNATDPKKFTLGYNDISIYDVSQYVASTGSTITLTNGNITFQISPNTTTLSNSGGVIATDTETPTDTSFDAQTTATANSFMNIFNNNQSAITASTNGYGTPYLPGRFVQVAVPPPVGSNTDAQSNAQSANNTITQNMGEVNTRNQTFIDNLTAQRQIIRDQTSVVQSTAHEAQQKMSQLSDLLTSFLSTFSTLVRSIAK